MTESGMSFIIFSVNWRPDLWERVIKALATYGNEFLALYSVNLIGIVFTQIYRVSAANDLASMRASNLGIKADK